MRLNKFIADAGVCSRRKADEMIKEGRVTVNKHEAVIGMEVSPEDVVKVDGERVKINTNYEYYMLNKPKRVICSSEDKFGRKLAIDYIKSKKRLYTYGRLDYMTEGLIIISNDGDIYNHVMHPSKKLYKSYIARLDKEITDDHVEALKHGVVIEGRRTAPAKVKIIDRRDKNCNFWRKKQTDKKNAGNTGVWNQIPEENKSRRTVSRNFGSGALQSFDRGRN